MRFKHENDVPRYYCPHGMRHAKLVPHVSRYRSFITIGPPGEKIYPNKDNEPE
jgi:hypothetical protein